MDFDGVDKERVGDRFNHIPAILTLILIKMLEKLMQHSIDRTLDRLIPVGIASRETCLSKRGDVLDTEALLERGPV